jgi:hypothetical protein
MPCISRQYYFTNTSITRFQFNHTACEQQPLPDGIGSGGSAAVPVAVSTVLIAVSSSLRRGFPMAAAGACHSPTMLARMLGPLGLWFEFILSGAICPWGPSCGMSCRPSSRHICTKPRSLSVRANTPGFQGAGATKFDLPPPAGVEVCMRS